MAPLSKKIEFSDIPAEVDVMIAKHLEPADLTSLMRTTRPLAELLAPERDHKAMQYSSYYIGNILHWAVLRGENNLAERILKRGLSVDAGVNYFGQTPLHTAARDGRADFTELFLKWGADIEARDSDSETPLWLAARNRNLAVVKILLKEGANAAATRRHPEPVTILNATIENSIDLPRHKQMQLEPVIYHLLNGNPDPSKRSVPDGKTFRLAIDECFPAAIRLLSEAGAESPFAKGFMVQRHMHHAIKRNSPSLIEYLVEMDGTSELSGFLPYAAQYASLPTLRFLANFNPKDFQTQEILDDCLFRAVVGRKTTTVQFLLSCGANTSTLFCLDCNGLGNGTALHRALFVKDKGQLARILISEGSDLNAKDSNGRSPISLAVGSGWRAAGMVKVLIDAGANALETDEYGQTLLHKAVTADIRVILIGKIDETTLFTNVELLLQRGVDINKRDDYGFTVLHCALPVWPRSVIEFLIRSGADPAIKPNGQSLEDLVEGGRYSLKPDRKSEVLEFVTELEGRGN